MPKAVFDKDIIVHTPDGARCVAFQAGVPRDYPDYFHPSVLMAGGAPADGGKVKTVAAPKKEFTEEEEGQIELIAIAMQRILDEAAPEKLTQSGDVRVKVLEAELGFNTTEEQRDAATDRMK